MPFALHLRTMKWLLLHVGHLARALQCRLGFPTISINITDYVQERGPRCTALLVTTEYRRFPIQWRMVYRQSLNKGHVERDLTMFVGYRSA